MQIYIIGFSIIRQAITVYIVMVLFSLIKYFANSCLYLTHFFSIFVWVIVMVHIFSRFSMFKRKLFHYKFWFGKLPLFVVSTIQQNISLTLQIFSNLTPIFHHLQYHLQYSKHYIFFNFNFLFFNFFVISFSIKLQLKLQL